jgi:RNA recognition motif-containing protein
MTHDINAFIKKRKTNKSYLIDDSILFRTNMLKKRINYPSLLQLILVMSISSKLRSFMTSAFIQHSPIGFQTASTSWSSIHKLYRSYGGIDTSSFFSPLQSNKYLSTSSLLTPKISSKWKTSNDDFKRFDSLQLSASMKRSSSRDEGTNNRPEKQKNRRGEQRKDEFTANQQQNFHENFRGTRVFVQGLPAHVSWQDLKDHFKVAGEVVFASVSIDPSKGTSKGCGIVQFETTDMANRAIQIMRDYPIDGSVLYVREDFQENKEGRNTRQQDVPTDRISSGGIPTKWKCADEMNLSLLSKEDLLVVQNLIKARDDARRRSNYDTSDIIREDLKKKFSVHIDDRLKLWWVSAENAVPRSVSEVKGDGRWGKLRPWRQIPTTIENDACVDADLVNGLLTQRDIARREKDFSTADRLLEEARVSPDGNLTLRIHDESRTWRIWTNEPPPRPVSTMEQESKMGPAAQCIMIVEKYDPSKVDEVKKLLDKFPGREYNILKKLKQNYNA